MVGVRGVGQEDVQQMVAGVAVCVPQSRGHCMATEGSGGRGAGRTRPLLVGAWAVGSLRAPLSRTNFELPVACRTSPPTWSWLRGQEETCHDLP